MTYIALKPKPITEQHSTCAECRYFSDFGDERGRGLCRVFDMVARRHHQRTSDCDSSIKTIEGETQPAFLFKVLLTSTEIEDDGYGYAVPVDEKLVEVVVAKPTRELVEKALANRNDLHGYEIVDFWQPEGGYEI
jgi:hypothetical protein